MTHVHVPYTIHSYILRSTLVVSTFIPSKLDNPHVAATVVNVVRYIHPYTHVTYVMPFVVVFYIVNTHQSTHRID